MSYDFTQCQFINFVDSAEVLSVCNWSGTEDEFFIAIKEESGNFITNGIFIFKEFGFFVLGERENFDFMSQANIFKMYMPKTDLLSYLNNLDRQYSYFNSLTQEQFDLLIETIENN